MVDRIAQRIEYFIVNQSISPKDFADKLGVQRSAISHILSGRNRPSLDFILKMLQAYPEIDQKWLLHGKERSQNDAENNNLAIENQIINQKTKPELGLFDDYDTDVNHQIITNVKEQVATAAQEVFNADNKQHEGIHKSKFIQRVILLYSDGSFDSYDPKNGEEFEKPKT